MSYKLEHPYTEEERTNFIVEYNHNQGLRIEEVENIVEVETSHYEPSYDEDGNFVEEVLVVDTIEENMPTLYALEPFEKLIDGEVIDNTEEYEAEKAKQEAERIGNLKCTKRVFALMLQELGISYAILKQLIATNEQAQLEWDLCVELERKNPLLDIMAGQLGITSEQLDGLFKYANGEITIEEFRLLIPNATPEEESEINSGDSVESEVEDV